MLINAKDLKSIYKKFVDIEEEVITRKLSVIESTIRKYTNNNFQNRSIRLVANIENGAIQGSNPYLKIGDTLEISENVNRGIYTIKAINDTTIELNEFIFDCGNTIITKVEYPIEIVEGAIDLLDWELLQKGKEKSGIASETISRHSVSYVQRNNDNTINGYPVELFNFCKEYKKARF